MSFWENVELLREEQNTSYRWLARMMGVSETTVSSMRRANTEPRASEAVKIASALGTTVESLVENHSEDDTPPSGSVYLKKYFDLKKELERLIEKF
ncbi:MAG: helix-turn-helix transcriptional regulator [Treponema sp.]|nr:helix-turn-helix transcriptional regulator [Treponema sp.]